MPNLVKTNEKTVFFHEYKDALHYQLFYKDFFLYVIYKLNRTKMKGKEVISSIKLPKLLRNGIRNETKFE